ncbi:MAG: efflux RND transporter periplasmic adaptor subunit [Pseudomonadota bacterium]
MRVQRFLGIASAVALVIGCGAEGDVETAESIRPAKLVTVEAATNQRNLSFPAVVRAAEFAELTFQIAGEIRELSVLEGQTVEEGFVIAKLDQRNAANALAQAKAEYSNAEAEYQRARRLVEQDAISRSTLDGRRTQRDIAQAAMNSAQKSFDDTVLSAPFDGGISRVYGRRFQNVQAKEAIAVIQSNEVEAVINVPGTIIARVPQLLPVGTTVTLDAAPDLAIPAEFKESSGVADENTQTYEITFTFTPPKELLILPGMTANVQSTFLFEGAKDIIPDGIATPLSAILSEGGKRYVWLVDTDSMTLSKREVEVVADTAENVIVTSGLNGGETIVAAGVPFFHDGMTIRSWSPE